jgi:hypothetical protein
MVVGVAVTVVAGASVSGGWEREGRRGDRGFERTRADTADRQNLFVPGLGTPRRALSPLTLTSGWGN